MKSLACDVAVSVGRNPCIFASSWLKDPMAFLYCYRVVCSHVGTQCYRGEYVVSCEKNGQQEGERFNDGIVEIHEIVP